MVCGRLNDAKLNISAHGRRVARLVLSWSFARERYSRFVVVMGWVDVGIVPYDVIVFR